MVPAARLFRAAGRVSSDSSGAGVRLAAASASGGRGGVCGVIGFPARTQQLFERLMLCTAYNVNTMIICKDVHPGTDSLHYYICRGDLDVLSKC